MQAQLNNELEFLTKISLSQLRFSKERKWKYLFYFQNKVFCKKFSK